MRPVGTPGIGSPMQPVTGVPTGQLSLPGRICLPHGPTLAGRIG